MLCMHSRCVYCVVVYTVHRDITVSYDIITLPYYESARQTNYKVCAVLSYKTKTNSLLVEPQFASAYPDKKQQYITEPADFI